MITLRLFKQAICTNTLLATETTNLVKSYEGKTVELPRDKPLVEMKENLCMNTGQYKMQTVDWM